ncbi:MAG: hypothetical protein FWG37_04455 [Clostridia bacterium]|nr:hypothetical protein [Clostridia bacterium]
MENEFVNGKVLPFERSAAYLRQIAVRQRKKGRILPALETLRRSLAKEPGNPETQLEVARTYAQMRCPELSNRVLFPLFAREEIAAECFRLAGCNFYAMNMVKSACDCFVLCLQKTPSGRHSREITQLIDRLNVDTVDRPGEKVQKRMRRVLNALDSGCPALAVRLARRLLALERCSGDACALLAYALLKNGEETAAYAAARRALHWDRDSIRTICAMAIILASTGQKSAARAFLNHAHKKAGKSGDMEYVCRTAYEIGDHARARDALLSLRQTAPLSTELLHLLAAASYNAGERAEALECWRTLQRIDPTDTVAEYRLKEAKTGQLAARITYAPDIPEHEVLSRLSCLSAIVREGVEGIRRRWIEDDTLKRLVHWGLRSSQPGIPEAMMGLLATIRTDCSTPLVAMLSDPYIPDDRKRSAITTLCRMDQNGPYYALINDRISLVRISRVNKASQGIYTQAEVLARRVKTRLGKLLDGEESLLLALCCAALKRDRWTNEAFRIKGIERAVRDIRGEGVHDAGQEIDRRRLARFTRGIMKEASDHEVRQL